MNYAPLITIKLNHEFYQNGRSADFALVSDAACQRILSQHRLLFRSGVSEWKLVTRLDGDQPAWPLPKDTVLRFFLRLDRPNALRISQYNYPTGSLPYLDLDYVIKGERFPWYVNNTGTELEKKVFYPTQTAELGVKKPSENEGFRIKGQVISRWTVDDFIIEGLDAGQQIKDYNREEKKIYLDTEKFAAEHPFTVHYRAVPAWANGVFAVVEITDKTPNATHRLFQMTINRREVPWQYYVVSNVPYDNLNVVEKNNEVDFDKCNLLEEPPTPEENAGCKEEVVNAKLLDWLKKKFPNAPTIALFTTSEKEFIEQGVKLDLQLKANGTVVQSHLPIPSPKQSEVQILKHFS